ncbi:HK97 gp10 family phage protein [Atlantibacter hermannii]|uniref:HK97 gp10 family phage protein n=1 Tax=Atlantibacter hermannii TaxID=565 RepID=UPI0028AF7BDE|nr:HK97 gp10 family phage protein [Atlantibacter hermannii]
MGVKVKGVRQVSRNINRVIDNIQHRKVARAIYSALNIGALQATDYTPVDTSVLINSQFRELVVNGTRMTGRVGYSANYAAYVHDPSIPQNFRLARAKKEFLTKGFEEKQTEIDAAVARELSL